MTKIGIVKIDIVLLGSIGIGLFFSAPAYLLGYMAGEKLIQSGMGPVICLWFVVVNAIILKKWTATSIDYSEKDET